jgi:endonuclease YncB( thermonuclease family)
MTKCRAVPLPLRILVGLKLAVMVAFCAFVAIALAQPEVPPVEAETEPPPVPVEKQIVMVPTVGLTTVGRVVSVQDGDTLKVEIKFVADIRLLDCWAPEIKGDERQKGFSSRDHLKKLAEGKNAVVHIPLTHENIGRATSMGRILGKVYINGDDLSYEQIRKGHATKDKPLPEIEK